MEGSKIHFNDVQMPRVADHMARRQVGGQSGSQVQVASLPSSPIDGLLDGLTLHLLGLGVLLAVLLLTGCAAPPMESPSEAAVPWETDQPWRQVESSVFYTPDALDEMAWNNQSVDDIRWYDSRNDHLNSVYAGQRTRIIRQRSVTYTHSNQGSSHGRVIDNSYQHTRSRRVEESVR